jgi:hypothetical protein
MSARGGCPSSWGIMAQSSELPQKSFDSILELTEYNNVLTINVWRCRGWHALQREFE